MLMQNLALRRSASVLALSFSILIGAPPTAQAETLYEALAAAYAVHPLINQERAVVRATDEQLAQAQSGFRPRVSANADYGLTTQNTGDAEFLTSSGAVPSESQILANRRNTQRNDGLFHPYGYNLQISQPVFDGFSTFGAIREAKANIGAARENLRAVEQRVLLDGIKAYTGVLRDRALTTLRENNLKILARELTATRERFAAGEMTKTDVAQAESRKARAAADLDLARANLRTALAEYERAVGHPATSLVPPPAADSVLPGSLEEAISISAAENPDVVEAAYMERASQHQITQLRGELLPQVTINASHQERYDFSNTIENQQNQSVTARLSMPLYTGGELEARIRAAKQQRQGRLEGIEQARQLMRAQTIAAWSQLVANRSQLQAVEQQVHAAQEALTGVREEQRAGQRTLIDVLNAEQELLDSQVTRERARRDLVVASYAVLSSIGRLTADQLALGVELYDADDNLKKTDRRAWGIRIDREEGYAGYEDRAAGLQDGWTTTTE